MLLSLGNWLGIDLLVVSNWFDIIWWVFFFFSSRVEMFLSQPTSFLNFALLILSPIPLRVE